MQKDTNDHDKMIVPVSASDATPAKPLRRDPTGVPVCGGRPWGEQAQAACPAAWTMLSTHSPPICRVAAFTRLKALMVAIATTRAASCRSS